MLEERRALCNFVFLTHWEALCGVCFPRYKAILLDSSGFLVLHTGCSVQRADCWIIQHINWCSVIPGEDGFGYVQVTAAKTSFFFWYTDWFSWSWALTTYPSFLLRNICGVHSFRTSSMSLSLTQMCWYWSQAGINRGVRLGERKISPFLSPSESGWLFIVWLGDSLLIAFSLFLRPAQILTK